MMSISKNRPKVKNKCGLLPVFLLKFGKIENGVISIYGGWCVVRGSLRLVCAFLIL